MTQAYSKKKETSRAANRTRTYDPPISVLDALSLSLTRLKLGRSLGDEVPVGKDWNVNM